MRRKFLLSVFASDLAALVVAFCLASLVVFGAFLPWNITLRGEAAGASIWPFAALLGIGAVVGSLLSARMWGRATPRPTYGRALAIAGFALAFTAIGIVLLRPYHSNAMLGVTTALWFGGMVAHRYARRRRPWSEKMLVVTREKGLVDDLRNADHADVIAVYDPGDGPPEGVEVGETALVVDLRPVLSDSMAQFVSSWNLAGYPVRSLTAVYEEHTGRLPIVHLAEGWELTAPVSRNEYAPFKRAIDTALILVSLPIWIILAAGIALAVRLDSRGPIIYRQSRVGRDGRIFTLYKFRTMGVDAERNGPQFATEDDDRLTRTGKWLRRSRLDEIPQLWNVLKGDLSLVGPRPERPVFTEQYDRTIPFYSYRHLVRPGVTGWAQVNYGYADDEARTVDKLTYDLYYVKHMSPWLDTEILGQSVWTVMSAFGAR
jgi:exopolysaccharide biosynthesis polyprenyl glycosylphosphotransferase